MSSTNGGDFLMNGLGWWLVQLYCSQHGLFILSLLNRWVESLGQVVLLNFLMHHIPHIAREQSNLLTCYLSLRIIIFVRWSCLKSFIAGLKSHTSFIEEWVYLILCLIGCLKSTLNAIFGLWDIHGVWPIDPSIDHSHVANTWCLSKLKNTNSVAVIDC